MTVKTKRISTLIETQLPEFITTEYELFSKFLQKYYEAQEVQGGTLDVISNIQKYADIDYYEQNLLKQNDVLVSNISDSDTTIVLEDASSFPEQNGYIKIDDEIIFYDTRTDTTLEGCVRGVSGNTSLGDLYESSDFNSTDAAAHSGGKKVHNVSNLFLYAFVKNFESQYLGSFPEKYLKGEVDKRTLIKNIQKFYKSKGTTSSIKFIFNTIVAKDIDDKPEIYKPRDFTYKASESDWINIYSLKVKVISGDPKSLVGKVINQTDPFVQATVDNVFEDSNADGERVWNIVLAPETVTGEFNISTKTKLTASLTDGATQGDRINVASTMGWDNIGSVLIGEEVIEFSDKNISQFVIEKRGSLPLTFLAGKEVYKPSLILGDGVTLLTLGMVYNIAPTTSEPYSFVGDKVQESLPGFLTADPRIIDINTNQVRWKLNNLGPVSVSTNPVIATDLSGVSTNVSAILEDDQYYYIASSSYPSYNILDVLEVDKAVKDQKQLRILRKRPISTTEIYKTPSRDVGILINGVPVYGYKDPESIRFGVLESIRVDNKGRNYTVPPFVLVDGLPNRAYAFLIGNVIDRIEVDTTDIFPQTPSIEITSGRGGKATAVVTGGEVTSITLDDPGKFYSAPPTVRIVDLAGKGRFAEYTTEVNTAGQITSINKVAGGTLYSQENIKVDVVSVGSDGEATPLLKEWIKNRFEKYKGVMDTQYGFLFPNSNLSLANGYAQLANPKKLRVELGDNLDSADSEPTIKTHSPIIGFAYDGNPIYGPFGYSDPLDATSTPIRMTSSYSLRGDRDRGPSETDYPLGSFIDDYKYSHRTGSLDENNGRFCVTPEFPEGTYVYFLTVNSNQVPQFPYVVGDKFYSLPVDSNYNSDISQDDIPKKSKRLNVAGMQGNGEGLIAEIGAVSSGILDSIEIQDSHNNFSINNKLYFDNTGTEGDSAEALVSSVTGENVQYLECKEDRVVKLTTIQSAYLFADDTLRQPASSASGSIVGTVKGDNVIVLRNVVGTFNNTGTFSADIKTFTITVDQDSNYTIGAVLRLTDGVNAPYATGEVLESTSKQNTVKIKVLTGTWEINDDYFIQSSNLFNTSGSKVVSLVSMSDGLEPFDVNQSVALIETDVNHGLAIGDEVTIDILPNDATKTKDYYVRQRLYQTAVIREPSNSSTIAYNGIGRFTILNGGADYTEGTYTNVPLTSGSGTAATANITVSAAGIVSDVQLSDGGSDYQRGDYLSVDDDELGRSGASQSTARLTLYVDHSGVSRTSTAIRVADPKGFAVNDKIQVGSEIMQIVAINGSDLSVTRELEGTERVDHYNNGLVILYKPTYNFDAGFNISNLIGSGTIQSYDRDTQTITLIYDYDVDKISADELINSTTFFDSSSPQRLVSMESVSDLEFKFEFSEDNSTFVPNPNIDLQEFYRYKFDTSHTSLQGTNFDISPSKSFNIITLEKLESNVLSGNVGSYTEVKFGFGPRIEENDYTNKVGTNFTYFYYFDRNDKVNAEGSYFKITNDPLQGVKTLRYVTPNRFVYDVPTEPLWDGSGQISYTTRGQFATGKIHEIAVTNFGENYKKTPEIIGADPSAEFRAEATVLYDANLGAITSVRLDNLGSNFSKPAAVIIEGDGQGALFNVVQRNGKIFSVTIRSIGKNYTYAPKIKIIETDTKLFPMSSSIGVPQSVNIIRNGGAYHLDKTVSSSLTSQVVASIVVSDDLAFQTGEKVTQTVNGVEVLSAKISEFKKGSNLVKLKDIHGILREGVDLEGFVSKSTAKVKAVFVSNFTEDITTFFDNQGYYNSDRGRLGAANQRLIDSYFYQDYSYVVKSKTSIEEWRDLIKSTTHPAGFQLFGQVDVETNAPVEMPKGQTKSDSFTILQLWDPAKNRITVESTKQVTTQSIQSVNDYKLKTGAGSVATSEFNFNETQAFEFRIYNMTAGYYDATINAGNQWWMKNPFDGYFDNDGRLQGSTQFQLRDMDNNPFNPVSAESCFVTLDGIIQEPLKSYTVSGDKINFIQPPLGDNEKLTGQSTNAKSPYKGVSFIGRTFFFKDSQYNNRYLKKARNIFQRGGLWIDAANQIEQNKEFIVQEAVGYGREKHPSLDWSTKLDDYSIDLGYALDAYAHDIRFGGNTKTVDYAEIFKKSKYISDYKTESIDIFDYAKKLANLAIRNWDMSLQSVQYITGSKTMTVEDSSRLVVGMHVSSGRGFATGTSIVSIDSSTSVTLSAPALQNSGIGVGGAPDGITNLSGTTTGDYNLPTNTGRVDLGGQFSVEPGDDLIVPLSFSGIESATFYLSAINSGTFVDASNLIAGNKEYIKEETVGWAQATYPSVPWNENEGKCMRDLGFLVDRIVYHLRYGGNEKIVEMAQLYWTKASYPNRELLTGIGDEKDESLAAFNYAKDLMIEAMRNTLGAGTYTSISPFVDATVSADSEFPYCVEVETTLNTYIDIIEDIFNKGVGVVEITKENNNKTGNWTPLTTYSNYNIIGDDQLPFIECNNVVSAIDSLHDNLSEVIGGTAVDKTIPDFIDGVNKEFDLLWEDGSPVITEEDERFFVTSNAVIQQTKFTATHPGGDAYHIDRTIVPNRIVFDVAPIWDQDAGAKTLGEPTAVEKVAVVGVGNYKRLSIDENIVDNQRSGPFLILDLEDKTVQNIESEDNLFVFIDGVLQKYGKSYTISGPNISFEFPITDQMKVDMRYLYGRDVGQILNLYNYNPDLYYAQAMASFRCTSNVAEFVRGTWQNIFKGYPLQCYQLKPDNTKMWIGNVNNLFVNDLGGGEADITFEVSGNEAELQDSPLYFCIARKYQYEIGLDVDVSNSSLVYEKDENNELTIRGNDQAWRGTVIRKSYKNPFINLSNNSKIKVDGEKNFRRIKELPSVLRTSEGRVGRQLSNSYYGYVNVEAYNGVTRGEGLSVVATIENGSVTKLTWNQRSFDPVTQPTAYQYYTPPVLNFIPTNGEGGGARACVIVSKGQVLSVDLTDGGSGYTEAPKIIVARKYQVEKENDIGVSLIDLKINAVVALSLNMSSTIDLLANQVSGINTLSSIFFRSPVDEVKDITCHIWPEDQAANEDLDISTALPLYKITDSRDQTVPIINTFHNFTEINGFIDMGEIVDIRSGSSIYYLDVDKVITTTVQTEIYNTSLDNVNQYENAAFLNVPLDIGDVIAYVADTSKFKSNGYLLIGDEVVRYLRKGTDRFISVQRAQDGTTEKNWNAGTYLRQIPDPSVTVAYGGIAMVESQAVTVEMGGIASGLGGGSETGQDRNRTTQVITPDVTKARVEQQIEVRLNKDIAVDSISALETQVNYKLETFAVNVTPGTLQYNATVATQQVQIEPLITIQQITKDIEADLQIIDVVDSLKSVTVEAIKTVPSEYTATTEETKHNITIVAGEIQKIITEISVQRGAMELLIIPPPSGAIDGYLETVFITDPIETRFNGFVELDPKTYPVIQRDGTIIYPINSVAGADTGYIGDYVKTNAGPTLGSWDYVSFDDGTANVSGFTLESLQRLYPALTINDFVERASSSFTTAGDYFNLSTPSIQNPLALSASTQPLGTAGVNALDVVVNSTVNFPDTGYLFHQSFGVSGPAGFLWDQKVYGSGTVNLETTADKKFGTTSVFLDETAGTSDGSFLSSVGTDAELGDGDFTIEFWANREVINIGGTTSAGLFYYGGNALTGAAWENTGVFQYFLPQFGFSIYMQNVQQTNTCNMTFYNGGDQSYTSIGNLLPVWTHFAIVRESGTIKVYVDGVEKASKANTQNYTAAGAAADSNAWSVGGNAMIQIGSSNIATGLDCFHGYIDQVHVSSIARYSGTFAPPTAQQNPDANTISYEDFEVSVPGKTGVIEYTGKNANTFTGCVQYRGDNQIGEGAEIVPFTID